MDAHVVAFKVTVLKMYVKFLSPNKMSESNLFASLCQDLDRWRIVHRVRTRVLGISLVNLVNSSCFICEVEHDFFGVSVGWASRQVLLQDRSEQCRVCFCRGVGPYRHRHIDTKTSFRCLRTPLTMRSPGSFFRSAYFVFFSRWGCREHFVSGCWHSSGRDSLPQGVLVICFGSAASWRPCNVVCPHQGPVSHS